MRHVAFVAASTSASAFSYKTRPSQTAVGMRSRTKILLKTITARSLRNGCRRP
jgi:hypothetical protein